MSHPPLWVMICTNIQYWCLHLSLYTIYVYMYIIYIYIIIIYNIYTYFSTCPKHLINIKKRLKAQTSYPSFQGVAPTSVVAALELPATLCHSSALPKPVWTSTASVSRGSPEMGAATVWLFNSHGESTRNGGFDAKNIYKLPKGNHPDWGELQSSGSFRNWDRSSSPMFYTPYFSSKKHWETYGNMSFGSMEWNDLYILQRNLSAIGAGNTKKLHWGSWWGISK